MIEATISPADARQTTWDVVVIGAGPAGAISTLGLAGAGARVLLVDRKDFPRDKVCGGCLNGDSVGALRGLGLGTRLDTLGGIALTRFHLSAGRQPLSLELPAGLAVSRRALDAMLVEAAVEAGANFLPSSRLFVQLSKPGDDFRELAFAGCSGAANLQTRVVVVATGLSSDLAVAADPDLAIRRSPQSRIGVGTTTLSFPDHYQPGTLFMAVGRSGYVGLTETQANVLNIAAALDIGAVRAQGPAAVCKRILTEAGFPVERDMLSASWSGTPALTSRRLRPASHRLFVVGDAAGYVEPFTGEGMAWAIRGGRALVPFALRAVNNWNLEMALQWSLRLGTLVDRRQKLCRALVWALRHPLLVRGAIGLASTWPGLGREVIRHLNRENECESFNPGAGNIRAA